jgi:hypothetical protein
MRKFILLLTPTLQGCASWVAECHADSHCQQQLNAASENIHQQATEADAVNRHADCMRSTGDVQLCGRIAP